MRGTWRLFVVGGTLIVAAWAGSDRARAQQGPTPSPTPGFAECGYTGEATSGPYYIANAPETEDLNMRDLPGRAMVISGTVYDGRSGEPIEGAQIEVWQTDANGRYWPAASGDAADFDPASINLRGIVVSDEDGHYEFTSVEPGVYPGRPRHIHYRISAEGYRPIFTQTYWADDPSVARDRADRNVEACRLLSFEEDAHGAVTATFNIFLRPEVSAGAEG